MIRHLCKKCGKCCHDVPLDLREFAMFSYIADLKGIELDILSRGDGRVQIGKCPFLKEDNTCEIYKFRPHICIIYPINIECEYTKDN